RRAGEDGTSRSQLGSVVHCAASSRASRVFIVHHARRAGQFGEKWNLLELSYILAIHTLGAEDSFQS
ncbi:hypothetical protein A2U01_0072475, partial [Trifolium medium]|nr:hypothetical protein [Trifolium medium]